jgi:fructose-1,6-bisphosphatase/inositol monophosphatase family enzyme
MQLESRQDFAREFAHQAAPLIRGHFYDELTSWQKDDTPTHLTDHLINQLFIKGVSAKFANDTVFGEDGATDDNHSEYKWVIDAIDGSIAYCSKSPTFMVSISLLRYNQPVWAMAYDVFLNRTFWASNNQSFLEDHLIGARARVIQVSRQNDLNKTIVGMASWKGTKYRIRGLRDLLEDHGCHVENLGSTTYMSALLALGEYGIVYYLDDKVHDIITPKMLVENAGGTVTFLDGSPADHSQPIRGLILSNGILHDQAINLVKQLQT